jgi:hypothetical protein
MREAANAALLTDWSAADDGPDTGADDIAALLAEL